MRPDHFLDIAQKNVRFEDDKFDPHAYDQTLALFAIAFAIQDLADMVAAWRDRVA